MTKRINLALQGGGAHGAFTWGVLDRILEEDDIEIAAISGTSAGALNGAALKSGMIRNGREGAKEMLDWVWTEVGRLDSLSLPEWMNAWLPDPGILSLAVEYSPAFAAGDGLTRALSPYAWGPLYQNPVQPIAERLDFGEVCAAGGPDLYICATAVRDGKVRVFSGEHITTEAILASACLPTVFQAVYATCPLSGEREAFWDGGYTGNPALFPLFQPELPDDVLIVNINPLEVDRLPVTPQEIQNRINEISFNSSLLRELRAIEFVQRLISAGSVAEGAMKRVLVHMVSDDELMNRLSVATKLVPISTVILQLKEAGRRAAGDFLYHHRDDIGVRQSADLVKMFN
ncbi:Patatin-like phospholipase [Roseivivax jejudonensis]|uniref:Patatin-like phospholipase n=1 Tax=Roseivivax jejudonensis TaxID=1529041 RepID=A0A1X6YNI4_9RHOB|nr:patatin-like phospholipase family protein [Roseivivax jejudonensis]SLN26790.1 Patatin-like phospholipase [Roseivivax jejudonensis]